MGFGKWIAGGLGWAIFGPIGGIVGYMIGSAVSGGNGDGDTMTKTRTRTTTRGDFMISLTVLTAAVMKADGVVRKSELDYVKDYFVKSFGVGAANDAVRMLRDILKQEIPVKEVSVQIGNNLDYSSKLTLMHYLFGISKADGHTDKTEVDLIERIANYMRISGSDFSSIKAMFYDDTHSAYNVLGLDSSVSDAEVKKAYRKMAVENHPDKVSYLGEDVQKQAEIKFKTINLAYEAIKRERGMS